MDTLPDTHMRRIRDIDFCSQELETLLPGHTQKLTGTTLDAYGAVVQQVAERSATTSTTTDFCFFSSWIPAITSGTVRDGGFEGTVQGHVSAAIGDGDVEDVRNRAWWGIPLCGGTPPHWVLGYADYTTRTVGIVDSMPQLCSRRWAEPRLHGAIDAIRQSLGLEAIYWDEFQFTVRSPAAEDQQVDSWSCGLFVMIAMQNLADGWPEPLLGESAKEHVRAGALRALLTVPLRPSLTRSTGGADKIPAPPIGVDQPVSSDDVVQQAGPTWSTQKKRARSHDTAICSSDGDGDVPHHQAKKPKRRRKNPAQRQQTLDSDEWTGTVEPHRVLCVGCNSWIALRNDREYDLKNWDKHRMACPRISGVVKHRTAMKEGTRIHDEANTSSLFNYFQLQAAPRVQPKKATVKYKTVVAAAPPPITDYFHVIPPSSQASTSPSSDCELSSDGDPGEPDSEDLPEPILQPCQHLRGPPYEEYVLHTQTRTLGGISRTFHGRVVRCLFPYKPLPPLHFDEDDDADDIMRPLLLPTMLEMPEDGNKEVAEKKWTRSEQSRLDEMLKAYARWEVDYPHRFVKAKACSGLTSNTSGVCDACEDLAQNDDGLKKGLYRSKKEAAMPEDEQRSKHVAREKYAPHAVRALEARELQTRMADPHIFRLWKLLEHDKSTESFIELYEQARDGKLANMQTFIDICKVMAEQVRRRTDSNPKLKHGMRYSQDYMNFMVLMHSYGQKSAQQYSILSGAVGGPCARSLRYFVKRSPDCLSDPDLVFENVARVKRLLDALQYTGPVALAGDCTKVKKRLTFSNDYGSHVLGAALPLEECAVKDTNDIEDIVTKVAESNAFATQVRAILVKVPLPQIPPLVIALRPTKGNDDAIGIHRDHMRFLAMAKQLDIRVISMAADGAASELSAQSLMDQEKSEQQPLAYDFPLYGIHLRAPVFQTTGPLISIQDPPHARKTCRNQPQHGTHTASMGKGYLVNRSFIQLYETGISGLQLRDVQDVDKQDDGAARRIFHHMALSATTQEQLDGTRKIHPEFTGLFVYLFIFGELFDAWLNRRLSAQDRVLAALRARFFLYIWQCHIRQMAKRFPGMYRMDRSFISSPSFHIFNRLCDTLVLLVLAYSRHYPTQPFCPWLLGTEFVEHFFGLARSLLPDFTYAEMLKLVKHVMLRQQILLSGTVQAKKERSSRSGYILDYDPTPLTPEELLQSCVHMPDYRLNELVVLAFDEASEISKQILSMTVPSFPLNLAPLQAPAPFRRRNHASDGDDTDGDNEDDFSELEEQDDIENDSDGTADGTSVLAEDQDEISAGADAAHYTARYAALSEDYEAMLDEYPDAIEPGRVAFPAPALTDERMDAILPPTPTSEILDEHRKVSIASIVKLREKHQSGTSTRSERVIAIDQKFALGRLLDPTKNFMTIRQAAHHLRVYQALTVGGRQEKTIRELRWQATVKHVQSSVPEQELPNIASKNVNAMSPLRPGNFVVMRNSDTSTLYVGEILDLYKYVSRRHGSIDSAASLSGLSYISLRVYLPLGVGALSGRAAASHGRKDANDSDTDSQSESDSDDDEPTHFSCVSKSVNIFTHGFAHELLYHLGANVMQGTPQVSTLKPWASARWVALRKIKFSDPKAKPAATTKAAQNTQGTQPATTAKATQGTQATQPAATVKATQQGKSATETKSTMARRKPTPRPRTKGAVGPKSTKNGTTK